MPTSRQSLSVHFEELVQRAVRHVSPDMTRALEAAVAAESDNTAKGVLATIMERTQEAKAKGRGLTTDTGLVTFFVRAGSSFPGLSTLHDALRDAVAASTKHEPIAPHAADVVTGQTLTTNTGSGVPVVHFEVVPGSSDCHVTVLLKGAASDMLTALWMLPPSTTFAEIGDRLASHIAAAGGRPCPPLVLGVGLGGTPERAVMLSRRALLRPVGEAHVDPRLHEAESGWRAAVNGTGIGPMGMGGRTTALAVHVEAADRHRAAFPVALSVACWSDRRASVSIDRNGDVHW